MWHSGYIWRQVHSPLRKQPARAAADTTDGADNADNDADNADGADGADSFGGADNEPTPKLRRGSSLLELCKNEQWTEMIDELARSTQVRGSGGAVEG